MAMAVMRITLNIVLCFYPTASLLVKPILQKQPIAARVSLQFLARLPMNSLETLL
jgi:hypothetical protein